MIPNINIVFMLLLYIDFKIWSTKVMRHKLFSCNFCVQMLRFGQYWDSDDMWKLWGFVCYNVIHTRSYVSLVLKSKNFVKTLEYKSHMIFVLVLVPQLRQLLNSHSWLETCLLFPNKGLKSNAHLYMVMVPTKNKL